MWMKFWIIAHAKDNYIIITVLLWVLPENWPFVCGIGAVLLYDTAYTDSKFTEVSLYFFIVVVVTAIIVETWCSAYIHHLKTKDFCFRTISSYTSLDETKGVCVFTLTVLSLSLSLSLSFFLSTSLLLHWDLELAAHYAKFIPRV